VPCSSEKNNNRDEQQPCNYVYHPHDSDDFVLSHFDRLIIPALLWLAEATGKLRRRGPRFKYPYMLAAGNNLAITARLYEQAGGFAHTSIEQAHEDTVLSEAVRTLTERKFEAVAVSLMWSIANGAHEQAIARILAHKIKQALRPELWLRTASARHR